MGRRRYEKLSSICLRWVSLEVAILAEGFLESTITVRVGDTIIVSGNAGKITDIILMFTVIDTETGRLVISNSFMETMILCKEEKRMITL